MPLVGHGKADAEAAQRQDNKNDGTARQAKRREIPVRNRTRE